MHEWCVLIFFKYAHVNKRYFVNDLCSNQYSEKRSWFFRNFQKED